MEHEIILKHQCQLIIKSTQINEVYIKLHFFSSCQMNYRFLRLLKF